MSAFTADAPCRTNKLTSSSDQPELILFLSGFIIITVLPKTEMKLPILGLTIGYNWLVKHRNSRLVLPASLFAGSFLGLLLIMIFSDPVQNISYAILFFAILLVLLLSFGHLLVSLGSNKINRRSRSKILIINVLLVIILMFRSAGSLNWVDILVLVLLGAGLLFYSSRRER